MNSEHEILTKIEENNFATQRELANRTGMSLGSVNLLIKKLVKKGLLKIERLNSRNIRYILTPQGLKQKTELTYKYIKNSYQYIRKMEAYIENLINKHDLINKKCVYLFGPRDEIMQIIQSVFLKYGIINRSIENEDEFDFFNNNNSYYVITWKSKFSELLTIANHINILNNIEGA